MNFSSVSCEGSDEPALHDDPSLSVSSLNLNLGLSASISLQKLCARFNLFGKTIWRRIRPDLLDNKSVVLIHISTRRKSSPAFAIIPAWQSPLSSNLKRLSLAIYAMFSMSMAGIIFAARGSAA
jgi:hypothetical protein